MPVHPTRSAPPRVPLFSTPIGRLRGIAFIEGVSYLLLLGVAMPLKYLAGMPLAVKFTGWAHGILFLLFCAALLQAIPVRRWSALRSGLVFLSALVPLGTFFMDRWLRQENQKALESSLPLAAGSQTAAGIES